MKNNKDTLSDDSNELIKEIKIFENSLQPIIYLEKIIPDEILMIAYNGESRAGIVTIFNSTNKDLTKQCFLRVHSPITTIVRLVDKKLNFAIGHKDGSISFLDIENIEKPKQNFLLKGNGRPVRQLYRIANDTIIICDGGVLSLYHMETNKINPITYISEEKILFFDVYPNKNIIYVNDNHKLKWIGKSEYSRMIDLKDLEEEDITIIKSIDNDKVLLGCKNGSVFILNLDSQEKTLLKKSNKYPIMKIEIMDSDHCVIGDMKGGVEIWDTKNKSFYKILECESVITMITVDKSGEILIGDNQGKHYQFVSSLKISNQNENSEEIKSDFFTKNKN